MEYLLMLFVIWAAVKFVCVFFGGFCTIITDPTYKAELKKARLDKDKPKE